MLPTVVRLVEDRAIVIVPVLESSVLVKVEVPDEATVAVKRELDADDRVTLRVEFVEIDPESIVLVKYKVVVGTVDLVVVVDRCEDTILVEP